MKWYNYITFIVIAIVIVATTWEIKSNFFPTVKEVAVQDTVYIDREFETIKRVPVEVPVRTTVYKTKFDTVESVRFVRDTVIITTVNQDELLYNSRFLTSFPTAPKFLEMNVTSDYVEFTGFSIDGETQSSRWDKDDLWKLTLSTDDWVAYSGQDKLNKGAFQRIGAGYQYGLNPSPYVSYGVGYELGSFSGKLVAFGSKNPYISVGIEYEF